MLPDRMMLPDRSIWVPMLAKGNNCVSDEPHSFRERRGTYVAHATHNYLFEICEKCGGRLYTPWCASYEDVKRDIDHA